MDHVIRQPREWKHLQIMSIGKDFYLEYTKNLTSNRMTVQLAGLYGTWLWEAEAGR